jgi:hypothetical protein
LAKVRARAEQARNMAEDQMDIQCIRHELEAKTQAFSNAQRAAGINVDDAAMMMPAVTMAVILLLRCIILLFIPCIPY